MSADAVNELRATLRDLAAAGRELAPVLHAYYKVLKEQDFTPDQAFVLTRDMQGHLLAGARESAQRGDSSGWPG